MKIRPLAIESIGAAQRRLVVSMLALSVAAVLASWLAGEVRAGVPVPQAKSPEPLRASAAGEADPALERLIALHRSATLLSAAPALPEPAAHCTAARAN